MDPVAIAWDSNGKQTKSRSLLVFWHLPATDFEECRTVALGAEVAIPPLPYHVIRKSYYTTQGFGACSLLHCHSHPNCKSLSLLRQPRHLYLWLQANTTFPKSERTCIAEQKEHFTQTMGSSGMPSSAVPRVNASLQQPLCSQPCPAARVPVPTAEPAPSYFCPSNRGFANSGWAPCPCRGCSSGWLVQAEEQ